MKPIQAWQDAFGKQVATTRNILDLPSHYDLNPERYRVRENGTRVLIDDSTFVSDNTANFTLQPGVGNEVCLSTAERPRYIVNYESEASFAVQATQAFGAGDVLQVGLRDFRANENKVFFEFTQGPSLDVVVEKDGTELKRSTVDLDEVAPGFELTNPTRPFIDFNWYGVGPFNYGVTYTDETADVREQQYNKFIETLSITDQTSLSEANLNLFFDFQQGTANTNVLAGSCGYIIKGDPVSTNRAKAARFLNLPYTGAQEYQAVLAVRVSPERENVFVDLTETEVIWNAGDGELLVISVNPELTDADFITDPTGDGVTTGPVSPPQHNDSNTAIQYTKDVTTFPDQDNNIVSTTTDPGGYQIGFSASDAPGQGTSATRSSSNLLRKREIHSDNIAIFLAKRDGAQDTSVNVIFETEQDW